VTPKPSRSTTLRALVVADTQHGLRALQLNGWLNNDLLTPVYAITQGAGMGYLEKLRVRTVDLLWIELPGYLAITNRKATKVCYRLQDFIAQARRQDIKVVCFAPCGPVWKSEATISLTTNQLLQTSYHHACRLGIRSRLNAKEFSSAVWRVATSAKIPS
jgi:hypothetical protein